MKKTIVVLLVLVMLVVATTPAFASDNGPGGNRQRGPRGTFAMVGTVMAVDPVARTITVNVFTGNKLSQPKIGLDVVINTLETTKFIHKNEDGTKNFITFEEILVGDAVSINGKLADDIWTAKRITVAPDMNCLLP